MTGAPPRPARLFSRGSWAETRRIADVLRRETVGGALLLAAAVTALAWANSPWADGYRHFRETRVGPSAFHLDLDLATWAADGLLAVFFFVAGLELKREVVAGDLHDPRRAAVPVAAALGGVLAPAGVYLAIVWQTPGASSGWAIPTATDIAFALAVLAVAGRHLPAALRTFLLTLAVVDDLLAIVIIAVGYTSHLVPAAMAAAVLPVAAFAWVARRGRRTRWALIPLAFCAWALAHASGVHATVAGVVLAATVPVCSGSGPDRMGLAERFEHLLRPVSAGVAVPVFALLSTGVTMDGGQGLARALADPVAVGVIAGLVVGKPLGILAATWLVARFTRATLDDDLTWVDVLGIALLGGVGFTVSLLIGELAFGLGDPREDHVTLAILVGSLASGLLASALLWARSRAYRRILAREALDADGDGVPDAFQPGP